MYQVAADVWNGFAKNAHEGLGSPRLIVPATLLLLGGQVVPLLWLPFASSASIKILLAVAVFASFLPRFLAALRFQQSIFAAVLHPLGICILVSIQWTSLLRRLRQRPAVWKGRSYQPAPAR
jgi:hypothetical protein